MYSLILFVVVVLILLGLYSYIVKLIDPVKWKWKYYSYMLHKNSVETYSNSQPKSENKVGCLLQIANVYDDIHPFISSMADSCSCFEYDNIRYYVRECSDTIMIITITKENKTLIVFEDGKWLHKGSWCKKIKNTLVDIDKMINLESKREKDKEQQKVDDEVNFFRDENEKKTKNNKRTKKHKEEVVIDESIKKRLSSVRDDGN